MCPSFFLCASACQMVFPREHINTYLWSLGSVVVTEVILNHSMIFPHTSSVSFVPPLVMLVCEMRHGASIRVLLAASICNCPKIDDTLQHDQWVWGILLWPPRKLLYPQLLGTASLLLLSFLCWKHTLHRLVKWSTYHQNSGLSTELPISYRTSILTLTRDPEAKILERLYRVPKNSTNKKLYCNEIIFINYLPRGLHS